MTKEDEYKLKDFKLEVKEDELFLTHPSCEFISSFNPKFPPYYYISLIHQQNKELQKEVDKLNNAFDVEKIYIEEADKEITQLKAEAKEIIDLSNTFYSSSKVYEKKQNTTIEKQRKEIEELKASRKSDINNWILEEERNSELKAEAKEKDERIKHILDNYSIEYVVKSKLKELLNQ